MDSTKSLKALSAGRLQFNKPFNRQSIAVELTPLEKGKKLNELNGKLNELVGVEQLKCVGDSTVQLDGKDLIHYCDLYPGGCWCSDKLTGVCTSAKCEHHQEAA